MKKIFILITTLFIMFSCQKTEELKKVEPIKDTKDLSVLQSTNTWWIKIDLDKSYYYLDSLEKKYSKDSFKNIIWNKPYTIVYFYPKDWTPNCTIQSIDFSSMIKEFDDLWYQIIWVSKDDLESHKKFAEANSLKIKLLQDKNSDLLKEFWALWELKEYWNWTDKTDIIRSTFIIDNKWNPIYAFKDVEAVWHAKRIYELISKK